MNKMKGSTGVKIFAWVLLTLSMGIFIGGGILSVGFNEIGIYTKNADEVKKELYENVSNAYSVRALSNMGQDYGNTYFKDRYFRYGIIQAENVDGLDLSDAGIYEEKYFTGQPSPGSIYLYQAEINDDTSYYYGENIFEAFGNVSHPSREETLKIEETGYDAKHGIYYYMAGGEYYPVREVKLKFILEQREDGYESATYTFRYDFVSSSYRNEGYEDWSFLPYEGNEVESGQTTASEQEEQETSDIPQDTTVNPLRSVNEILDQEYVTFDEFRETDQPVEGIRQVYLDGNFFANSGMYMIDIIKPDDKRINTIDTDYYAESESILQVYKEQSDLKTYWVISIIPDNVGTGWSDDMFVQANTLVNLAYSLRYSIYIILLIAFIVSLSSLIFLFCGAGHRKNTEEIVGGWLEKMPLEIYTAATMFIGFFLCWAMFEMVYSDMAAMWFFAVLIVWCLGAISLLYALSFAVRVKTGKWWRNTLLYRIFNWWGGILSLLAENMPMLIKAVVTFGVISFIELFVIFITEYYVGLLLLFWLAEKLVIAAVLLLVLIQMKKLQEGSGRIAEGDISHQIDTSKMFWEFKKHGDNLNSIGAGMSRAVDERMKSERFKTELITNVSHDIKTPLTSIINYVDLLEKEKLGNENAEEYLEVLTRQSARLKKLIEDLMEASKASTGNLAVNMERLEAGVFMVQTVGEFEEKTMAANLELIITKPEEPVYILADGRHFWRVIDNLMNNVCKYAQPSTRVYINLEVEGTKVSVTFRNTSRYPLNISSDELMERFVRGDSSRNTEGSGLGLSIAQSMMELMNGKLQLYVDGDLFKVVLSFQTAK